MALTRIMIGGRAEAIDNPTEARRRYLARHPDASRHYGHGEPPDISSDV